MISSHIGVSVGFEVAPRIFVSGALGAKDRVNHHAVSAGFQSVDLSHVLTSCSILKELPLRME